MRGQLSTATTHNHVRYDILQYTVNINDNMNDDKLCDQYSVIIHSDIK